MNHGIFQLINHIEFKQASLKICSRHVHKKSRLQNHDKILFERLLAQKEENVR